MKIPVTVYETVPETGMGIDALVMFGTFRFKYEGEPTRYVEIVLKDYQKYLKYTIGVEK